MKKRLNKKDKLSLSSVIAAAKENRLCVVLCTDKKTGKPVSVICESWEDNGSVVINPLAKLFDGSPFNQVTPPGASTQLLI